jgi:hypothetical protein
MKKWVYRFSYICLLLFVSGCHTNQMNETEVLSFYDEFLSQVHELFAYHTYEGDVFFNEKYHTEDAIRSLLTPYMTEEGIHQMLEELYVQEDERYVYNGEFQSYLRDYSRTEASYYELTRQTVFNPGLRMMTDGLEIHELAEELEIKAEAVPVHFYQEKSSYGQSQFGELGYPAVDYLSLTVKMVKDEEEYRIEFVEVQS